MRQVPSLQELQRSQKLLALTRLAHGREALLQSLDSLRRPPLCRQRRAEAQVRLVPRGLELYGLACLVCCLGVLAEFEVRSCKITAQATGFVESAGSGSGPVLLRNSCVGRDTNCSAAAGS